jgi:hypothetical protein
LRIFRTAPFTGTRATSSETYIGPKLSKKWVANDPSAALLSPPRLNAAQETDNCPASLARFPFLLPAVPFMFMFDANRVLNEGGVMELDQWLVVYQTIVRSASLKEQTRWSLVIGATLVQAILGVAAVFLVFVEPMPLAGLRLPLTIGLISVGLLVGLGCLVGEKKLRTEASHLEALARGIESQFAGGEFFRSLHRLAAREKVCTAGSSWTCGEWLPGVSRLPLLVRLVPECGRVAMTWPFVLGWVALLVRVVTA